MKKLRPSIFTLLVLAPCAMQGMNDKNEKCKTENRNETSGLILSNGTPIKDLEPYGHDKIGLENSLIFMEMKIHKLKRYIKFGEDNQHFIAATHTLSTSNDGENEKIVGMNREESIKFKKKEKHNEALSSVEKKLIAHNLNLGGLEKEGDRLKAKIMDLLNEIKRLETNGIEVLEKDENDGDELDCKLKPVALCREWKMP